MRLLKYAELGRYSKLGLYHLRRQVGAAMATLPKGSYAHRVGVKNLRRIAFVLSRLRNYPAT